jgi:hypothetical protein
MVVTAVGSTITSLSQAPWYVSLLLTVAGVASFLAFLWSFRR